MRKTGAVLALLMVGWVHPARAEPVELRGAWLHASACKTPEAADAVLRRADLANLNALFVLVFYWNGQAAYKTDLAPMLEGVAEEFDPLAHLVEKGREKGIEVHAWFVNGSRGHGKRKGILDEKPEWRMMDISGRRTDWYDLCQPDVRRFQARLMVDCLRRYDVASVHFDYIRFLGGSDECVCPVCRENCRRDTGLDLDEMCYPELPALGDLSANPLAEPTTAKVLATFDHGPAALAVNDLGQGRVVLFNWSVHRWLPQAMATPFRRILEAGGVREGGEVLVLDTVTNKENRWQRFTDGRDLVAGLGFKTRRITDENLAKLTPRAAVILPGFYGMTDEAAKSLSAHVEAGGLAVFLDGPVFAMRKSEAARTLLGFKTTGKYFNGVATLRAAPAGAGLVPASDRPFSVEAEQAKLAAWDRWRMDQVSALVRQVSDEARQAKPAGRTTAAVFRDQEGARQVRQDWPRWLREGWLDYAIPMSYFPTPEELDKRFEWWKTFDPTLARVIPSIGVHLVGKELGPAERAAEVLKQVEVCRRHTPHGLLMFQLGSIDDPTAEALGRTAFPGKAAPWHPAPR